MLLKKTKEVFTKIERVWVGPISVDAARCIWASQKEIPPRVVSSEPIGGVHTLGGVKRFGCCLG